MLLDYLEKLNETISIEDLWILHTETMATFGFDRLLYGFTQFRTAQSFGDKKDMLVLTNHDATYTDTYMNGLYFHAPMLRWATENVGACSWRWMSENADDLTASERKVLEFNRKMHVTAGYTISFREVSVRSKGAIALAARRGLTQDDIDSVWAEHGRMIVQMNNVAHLKITNLPFVTARKSLTPRQRETLEWVGNGKTSQDIAQIMGLTPATVEKHLRLAREALDVETTTQAVLKASFQNQIFVLET